MNFEQDWLHFVHFPPHETSSILQSFDAPSGQHLEPTQLHPSHLSKPSDEKSRQRPKAWRALQWIDLQQRLKLSCHLKDPKGCVGQIYSQTTRRMSVGGTEALLCCQPVDLKNKIIMRMQMRYREGKCRYLLYLYLDLRDRSARERHKEREILIKLTSKSASLNR